MKFRAEKHRPAKCGKLRKTIALLCVLTMLVPTGAFAAGETSSEEKTKNITAETEGVITGTVPGYITFGSYPQTEIVAKAEDSGVYGKPWVKEGDYVVDADLFAALNSETTTWDDNNDTTIDVGGTATKYHRLKKNEAQYAADEESSEKFTWKDADSYHYFRYDPIKWRVLQRNANEAYLLSEKVLDDGKYKILTVGGVAWVDDYGIENLKQDRCLLRTWLNDTFKKSAFTETEINALKKDPEVSNETTDVVYALTNSKASGLEGIKNGFNPDLNANDPARRAQASTYAKARGIWASSNSECMGNSYWWLRSIGACDGPPRATISGNIDSRMSFLNCYNDSYGIRPAVCLDLSKTAVYREEQKAVTLTESNVTLNPSSFVYDGKEKKPEVIIPGLAEGLDYEVTYINNVKPGKARVKITGKGNCSGAITKSFQINLPEQQGRAIKEINYDLVAFGHYPQTEIVAKAEDSGVYGTPWVEEGDYEVDPILYNELNSENTQWSENETTIGDVKYCRMKRGDAPKSYPAGQDYGFGFADWTTYHYFRYDPIKWRVLKTNNDEAILMSDMVLDYQIYGDYNSTWETSSLRGWLNGTFLNKTFSETEKALILQKTVQNQNSLNYPEVSGGNDTQDRVYLLSESDVYTSNTAVVYGFNIDGTKRDQARKVRGSTYAKAMGLYSEPYDNSYLGCCYWWLRSPGSSNNSAVYVASNGTMYLQGNPAADFVKDLNGVRPVIHLDLKKTNLDIAGTTGKISELSAGDVEIPMDIYVYRGTPITPEVTIRGLEKDVDYVVEYSDNAKPGLATITITGKGNWSGTITRNFLITDPKDLVDISDMEISIPQESYYYKGEAISPTVTIRGLKEDTDFNVEYKDHNAIGTATITVTGKNGYSGTITKTFILTCCNEHNWGKWSVQKEANCTQKGLRKHECTVCKTVEEEDIPITHKLQKTAAKAATCSEEGNRDYWTCTICNGVFKDADGKIPTTVVGETLQKTPHNLTHYPAVAATATTAGNSEYYYCSACKKYFSNSAGTIEIEENSWIIPATGSGGGGGGGGGGASEETGAFGTVTLARTTYAFTGKAVEPAVTVKDTQGNVLKKDQDYTVAYSNNINIGTATVTITGKGNYESCGTKSLAFQIKRATFGELSFNQEAYGYNGGYVTPEPILTDEFGDVVDVESCTVKYENNDRVGIATANVTSDIYIGEISGSFVINPKEVTLKSVKSGRRGSKSMAVKWKKPNKKCLKQCSGYEIIYDTDLSFENAKVVKVKRGKSTKKKTISKTVKKLKSKKTYYVKMRVYKKAADKNTYWSDWSKVKTVKIK